MEETDVVTVSRDSLAEVIDGLTLMGSMILICRNIEEQNILGVPTVDVTSAVEKFANQLKAAAEEKLGVTFE